MGKNRRVRFIHYKTLHKWVLPLGGAFIFFFLVRIPGQMQVLSNSMQYDKVFPTDTLLPTIIQEENKQLTRQDYIERAVDDLSRKLSIPADKIKVMRAVEKEFNDTSLGCREKDKFSAQVITPGYQIVLDASGDTYIYNAGLNIVVIC